jgi:hypothetical protein
VLPDGVQPNAPGSDTGPELRGAAAYGLIASPEPVTAADPDYLFSARVRRARFLAHAEDNFKKLDAEDAGFLTLAGLPETSIQRMLGRGGRRRG